MCNNYFANSVLNRYDDVNILALGKAKRIMDLIEKRVLVAGSGISGVAAAELLKKQQVEVVLFDGQSQNQG